MIDQYIWGPISWWRFELPDKEIAAHQRRDQARDLGFASVEDLDHAELAAHMAADPGDSLYAEETGDVEPPHPMQDFAAKVLRDAEAKRARVLQVRNAGAKGSKDGTDTANNRLALGRRLYTPGMSGTQLRKAYSKEGESVSQRTAERDLKKIRSDKN